jgi:hypothetical protein
LDFRTSVVTIENPQVMNKSQSSQLKSLEAMQKREEEQVMKNIEQESKVRNLLKVQSTDHLQTEEQAGVSADEQKRERANKLVKRGVTERRKLEVSGVHCPAFHLYTGTILLSRICTIAGERCWRLLTRR